MDTSVKNQRERMNQTKEGGRDRCVVSCKLRRNTFLPGEQIRGTVKIGVSSKGQSYVDIEQVCSPFQTTLRCTNVLDEDHS